MFLPCAALLCLASRRGAAPADRLSSARDRLSLSHGQAVPFFVYWG